MTSALGGKGVTNQTVLISCVSETVTHFADIIRASPLILLSQDVEEKVEMPRLRSGPAGKLAHEGRLVLPQPQLLLGRLGHVRDGQGVVGARGFESRVGSRRRGCALLAFGKSNSTILNLMLCSQIVSSITKAKDL